MITEINDVVNATYKEPTEVTLKAMQEFYGIQSVQYGTTEHWNLQKTLIAVKGMIYLYSDFKKVTGENGKEYYIAGVKVGDGNSYLIDMPFLNSDLAAMSEHISNTKIHVSQADRLLWDSRYKISEKDGTLIISMGG